jgi:transposase
MEAYSLDLRKRVLEDCDAKLPTKQVAEKYKVSEAWVRRLKQRRRETGEIGPRSSRPKTVKKTLADHAELLKQLVRDDADTTLEELRARLPVKVSVPTVWRALEDLKLSFKKKSCTPPSKTGRTSKKSARPGRPK